MTKNPYLLALLALSAAIFAIAPRAFAQANPNPPERLAYQGYLVDANGVPLATNAPKNYDVIFRIWNDPTAGAAGNRLWTEQQTVTVDKGYFSVVLGEGSGIGEARPALPTVFANATASERWIGLTVKGIGSGGSDANILPRLRLITSPYSFLASKAISVDGAGVTSGTVPDGRLSANVALRAGGNTFTGNQVINNLLGIGTATPNFPLSFPNTAGDKISLFGQSGAHIGFGVQGNLLQIHTDISSTDIAFGYGTSAALTETMRITGAGRLQVGGGVLARGGLPGLNGALNNGYAFAGNSGDNDSGMFSQSDGVLSLHVNNIERLRLDSTSTSNQLFFPDGGQIMSFDANHRILFRRSENKLELREFGDIIFSPGAGAGAETAKAVILASGNMGVGTNNPQAKLHVAGAVRVDGAMNVGAGSFLGSNPYLKFTDQKARGVAGGSSIVGVNLRTFNNEFDPQNLGSVTNNTNIVLPAGTYQCSIRSPAFRANHNQARLRIAGGGAILLNGTSQYTDTADGGDTAASVISGQFTLASQSALVVEHYFSVGRGGDGLGAAVNLNWPDGTSVEIYTVAEFWKLQ